ncbi:MAG: CHAP domain-containing protein [Bdellovibrionales bacterium]|nr:CHAP domain-containing protein [Bdellovibrionales bacterium]
MHRCKEKNFIEKNFTGLKWQCVEYCRRWLLQNNNLNFESVNFAYEIWKNINFCYNIKTKKQISFFNYENVSSTPPKKGDLLVYDKTFLQTGHVAIVVEVDLCKKYIRVAEQNYHNKIWKADYSREINLNIIKKNSCVFCEVADDHLLGWKSFA